MQLNPDQENAAQAFFQFLFSDEREFSISGPAGTGKTFLMKHLIGKVLDEFYNARHLLQGEAPPRFTPALTATTNKAADVLSNSTGTEATTIHSFLGLKVKEDYTSGKQTITKGRNAPFHVRSLLFIDEAPMVDQTLYKFILEGVCSKSKIVYLGDHCQMAPVNEKISPVYTNPKHFVKLSQPMRNAGSPQLISLCEDLRQTVETLSFSPLVESSPSVLYMTSREAQYFVDKTFQEQVPDHRILCFTNNQVRDYNAHIRSIRGYGDKFLPGEILVNNSVLKDNKDNVALRAEDRLKVLSVSDRTSFMRFQDKSMEIYQASVLTLDGRMSLSVNIPADYSHYRSLLKHFAQKKEWWIYWNLANNYPDLRPTDASTVYKSQGSTFHTVLMDLSDIGKCRDLDQLARMLYVGASRATDRLILFGHLPNRIFQKAA